MFLFLDVISPIPEFFIIEDNKIIFHRKIIKNQSDKLSDFIFESYIEINNQFKFSENLKKIAMTIGPGSYTSLRVGASFIAGLKLSLNLEFSPITIKDLFKYKNDESKFARFGFFISSANNQNFFCYLNENKNIDYIKVENSNLIPESNIDILFYNHNKLNQDSKNIKQYKFSFIDEVIKNSHKLIFYKNYTIEPIYISNNKVLS